MTNNLVEKLSDLLKNGWTKSKLEEQIGLPKNNLSSVLSGKKEMPAKWVLKIEAFLKNISNVTDVPVKQDKTPEVVVQEEGVSVYDKIAKIKARVIPPERNTFIGRKLWFIKQYKENKKLLEDDKRSKEKH